MGETAGRTTDEARSSVARERTGRGAGVSRQPAVEETTRHLRGPDWAWRRRIRANRHSHRVFRIVVGVLGTVVVIVGLILVPFPGPGWAIVFVGIAIWASEFDWAHKLLVWGKRILSRWTAWIMAHGWGVRFGVGLATFLVVLGVFWVLFRLMGVPPWLPDAAETMLHRYGGL